MSQGRQWMTIWLRLPEADRSTWSRIDRCGNLRRRAMYSGGRLPSEIMMMNMFSATPPVTTRPSHGTVVVTGDYADVPPGKILSSVWISDNTMERMPMWCPPTPPQGENDVYIDICVDSLYHQTAMTEAQLPGINVRRSPRPPRSPRPARRPAHHTVHHAHHAPRSLFERPAQLPRARPRVRVLPQHEADRAPEWSPAEDAALGSAVRAQGLPQDFSLATAALLPNWDFAADIVAEAARAYRSPRHCRDRYELAPPRDDAERRKQKKGRRTPPLHRAGRVRGADDDTATPRLVLARFDAMRQALERKTAAPKRRYDDPTTKNPRHAAALAEYGVDYEAALTPMDVATRRAERIAKEKSKAATTASPAPGAASAGASSASRVAPATPVAAVAPAAAAPAPTPTPPQRIVVAAHPVSTVVAKGVSGVGAVAGVSGVGAVAGVSGVSRAHLQLFRQQALARQQQQLKILQQQQQSPLQGGSGGTVTVTGRTQAETDAHAVLLKRQAAQKAAAAAAAAASGGAAPAVKMASPSQIRQLQLQQQLFAQRKVAAAAAAASTGAVRGARVLARPATPQQVVVAHLTPHSHPAAAPDQPHSQTQ